MRARPSGAARSWPCACNTPRPAVRREFSLVSVTTKRRHRRQPSGANGVAGNEHLAALTGVVLLVGFAIEGVTILRIGPLLTLHFFLGLLLIGPVLLKIGSTGYRIARYYTGAAPYVRRGPPALPLRLLGPFVIATSLAVLGTGVALGVVGPNNGSWLFLHKASFIFWLGFMTLQRTGSHLAAAAHPARPGWPAVIPAHRWRRPVAPGRHVPGRWPGHRPAGRPPGRSLGSGQVRPRPQVQALSTGARCSATRAARQFNRAGHQLERDEQPGSHGAPTTATGQGVCDSRVCATLPSIMCGRPRRPRRPSTSSWASYAGSSRAARADWMVIWRYSSTSGWSFSHLVTMPHSPHRCVRPWPARRARRPGRRPQSAGRAAAPPRSRRNPGRWLKH